MKKTAVFICIVGIYCPLLFAGTAITGGTELSETYNAAALPPARQVQSGADTEQTGRRWHGDEIGMEIPVPDHPYVRKFRAQYLTANGKKWLEAVMLHGAPYRYYIENKIREYNLPECLVFLPVIESNFVATAVSSSGAMGMWQFMKNSIAPFGIRANEWMDERRDPWLTTDAALKKLKENYTYFGDWYLALGAYNCGLGAMQRAVQKAGSRDFWYLAENGYLKQQTADYVPKFLAIAEILTHSGQNGIMLNGAQMFPDFTVIETKKAVDLTILAKKTGVSEKTLKTFNPALHYGITPPGVRYSLRVPADCEQQIREALTASSSILVNYYLYRIKSGDTLYALSKHYGISTQMLSEYNPGIKPDLLKIGQQIIIPAFKEVAPYEGKKDAGNLVFEGSYIIQPGDTLWSISLIYSIQVETLAQKNNLAVEAVLRTGTVLKVPIIQ